MSNMANNDYHKIANEILEEDEAAAKASQSTGKSGKQLGSLVEEATAAMEADGLGNDGGDGWLAERLNYIVDMVDPSEFFKLSAAEVNQVAGLGLDGEDAQIWDNADPLVRAELLDYIQKSAGMGKLSDAKPAQQ